MPPREKEKHYLGLSSGAAGTRTFARGRKKTRAKERKGSGQAAAAAVRALARCIYMRARAARTAQPVEDESIRSSRFALARAYKLSLPPRIASRFVSRARTRAERGSTRNHSNSIERRENRLLYSKISFSDLARDFALLSLFLFVRGLACVCFCA